jgi:hypothetical protein
MHHLCPVWESAQPPLRGELGRFISDYHCRKARNSDQPGINSVHLVLDALSVCVEDTAVPACL